MPDDHVVPGPSPVMATLPKNPGPSSSALPAAPPTPEAPPATLIQFPKLPMLPASAGGSKIAQSLLPADAVLESLAAEDDGGVDDADVLDVGRIPNDEPIALTKREAVMLSERIEEAMDLLEEAIPWMEHSDTPGAPKREYAALWKQLHETLAVVDSTHEIIVGVLEAVIARGNAIVTAAAITEASPSA